MIRPDHYFKPRADDCNVLMQPGAAHYSFTTGRLQLPRFKFLGFSGKFAKERICSEDRNARKPGNEPQPFAHSRISKCECGVLENLNLTARNGVSGSAQMTIFIRMGDEKSEDMSIVNRQIERQMSFRNDDDRWQAVVHRDRSADNSFVYTVKTTGVYCRPSCAARLARRENVQFHLTPADAERAGFRACMRCRPGEPSGVGEHAAAVVKACRLIAEAEGALDLKSLAGAVRMSPSHFHRVFKSLTGLTPKAYATARSSQRVREELSRSDTVTSAIYKAGFNSSGRFYATSSKVLGMKPGAFRAGGKGATIQSAVGECTLGSILVATSQIGICCIALGDDPNALVQDLQNRFPQAELTGGNREFEQRVARVIAFVEHPALGLDLPLDVRGTAFQQRVWQKLREIPCGQTCSYSQIAEGLGEPRARRAVAQACAANPIAVAIPCHRVVRTDGSLSGYRWGVERKVKLLKIERREC
jgi:AraC family transcriptional regulator of adaptative response/methylated-DNA-[protein]-cysteine methyltransferase